jgi:CRISPR-associated endonuclease/helicase Cas3
MIAHIHPITGTQQSIKGHCYGTAEFAEKFGNKIKLHNLAYIAGVLHDMGKNTQTFKIYLETAVKDKDNTKRGTVNHSGAGAIFVHERYYKGDDLHKLTAQLLINSIFSHHGLFDVITPEGKDIIGIKLSNKEQIEYEEAMKNFIEEVINLDELDQRFEYAVVEVEHFTYIIRNLIGVFTDERERYTAQDFYYGYLQRMLLSQLIDADRLDTAIFCGDREVIREKDKEFYRGLWDELISKLEYKLGEFTSLDKISTYRRMISEECYQFSNNPKGIYQLMVPTGGGKTLASLRFALHHAKNNEMERIIYAAPYMSILDQNADVIKNIFNRDDIMLEHHSNIIKESENEAEMWKHLTENWDCPIILTTMVQLLNTLFDGRTQCIRRMHNLANTVIIFDEIQSIPAKCIHTFNLAINFLCYACGSTIILCSATQPPLESAVNYKIILGKPGSIINNVEEVYDQFRRVKVVDKTRQVGYDAADLSEMISEIMEQSDNILTIMNTKKAATKLYYAVEERNKLLPQKDRAKVVLLTNNMCPKHRLDLIYAIRDKLNNKEKLIAISTSLIEAGVDISFQYVIRSLAGLDNIAQAAGRCNRNGELDKGNVIIINSTDENLSRLPEIKSAQNATNPILRKYEAEPKYFSGDLLSPLAMDNFYKRYYEFMKKEMNYRIKDRNTNLLDLLSMNEIGLRAYYTNSRIHPEMILNQAFKTAGEEFEVIVNNTKDIIVPYNEEAAELINILNGDSSLEEIKNALKKVQAYTINIFQQDFDTLSAMQCIKPLLNFGIYALADGFYSNETGITLDKNMEFLSI